MIANPDFKGFQLDDYTLFDVGRVAKIGLHLLRAQGIENPDDTRSFQTNRRDYCVTAAPLAGELDSRPDPKVMGLFTNDQPFPRDTKLTVMTRENGRQYSPSRDKTVDHIVTVEFVVPRDGALDGRWTNIKSDFETDGEPNPAAADYLLSNDPLAAIEKQAETARWQSIAIGREFLLQR